MKCIAMLAIAAAAVLAGVLMRMLTVRIAGEDAVGSARVSVQLPDVRKGIERLGTSWLSSLPVDRASMRRVERSLARSGLSLTVGSYWALCVAGGTVGAIVGIALSLALPAFPPFLRLAVAVLLAAVGALAPRMYVSLRIAKRRELIEATMSYTLDLLSVIVSSGQTIEQAIKTVGEKSDGPLAEEFALADKQISVLGMPATTALKDMADRVGVPVLSLFCASVRQALAAGSPLSEELKIQAEEAADRYYQAVDERAGKISNKMVFPLAFMMLPAILIVALVPMVLRLAEQMPGFLPGLA